LVYSPREPESEVERLGEAARQAAAELDAASKLPDVKVAAKRMQRVKAELKAAQGRGP
jgi:hypothetical protein